MTGGLEPAIDLAAGAGRVMGDRAMFERMLARFRGEYVQAAASIRAALAAGDTTLAQRHAHTLKGAAGMIEARILQRQALAVEQSLRVDGGDCEREIDRLDVELSRVMRAVDAVLDRASPGAGAR